MHQISVFKIWSELVEPDLHAHIWLKLGLVLDLGENNCT